MRSHQSHKNGIFAIIGVTVMLAAAAPLSAQTPPDPAGALCGVLPVDPLGGCVVWEDRYDGSSPADDGPTDVAVAPDGGRVFVSGFSFSRPPGSSTYDYVTVAYDAQTGEPLWAAEYEGEDANGDPARGEDFAMAVDVSPDSGTVFVTGGSFGYAPAAGVEATGVATIAYDAASGAVKWVARYQGAGLSNDLGRDVAVHPDGDKVYVVATLGGANNQDVGLLTYDAATGALLNDDVYTGPADRHDSVFFRSLAVAPDGGQLFVAAQVYVDPSSGYDYGLLRYDADGARTGISFYDGGEGNVERPFGIDVAPDGAQVYVTGRSRTSATDYDVATVAFDASGAQRWVARYDEVGGVDEAVVVRASADGRFVVAVGQSVGGKSGYDYVTVAYDAATGVENWVARHAGAGNGNDGATGVAISPDSAFVHVTGLAVGATQDTDMVTQTYDALSGLTLRTHTYVSTGQGADAGRDIEMAPDGGLLFLTGDTHTDPVTTFDIATLAIDGGAGGLPPLPLPAP